MTDYFQILYVSSARLQYVALLPLDGINAGLPRVALLFHIFRYTNLIHDLWLVVVAGSGMFKCRSC